ncbi:MAG: single-stranded DNA-binding protein [Bacteroidales bacterium]|nr:single-stranded DNA-binding protein [Bacteroidales bacterium]
MEQLNKVELIGTVGSVYVKEFGTTKVANFSVATNYCYKSSQGEPVIETTWHRVIAWDGPDTKDAFRISKGEQVHVIGRLRIQRYTGADGVERSMVEIVASRVGSIT